MTEVKPSKGIIVLKAPEEKENSFTQGGIALPQNLSQPNTDKVAIVAGVGWGVTSVVVGDKVICSPYNLVVAVIDDVKHIFAQEENIVAILK